MMLLDECTPLDEIDRRQEALINRLRSTLECITDALFTVDRQWRITFLNREAERLFQRPRETLLGAELWEALGNRMPGMFQEACQTAVAGGRIAELEEFCPVIGAWLNIRACPTPEGLALHLRDVTERKRDEPLRYLLAAIVQSSDDAIFSRDLEGRITSWNRAAERVFGYSAAEAVGRSMAMLVPPEKADELTWILSRTFLGESMKHVETRRRRKDNTVIDVLLTVSPIYDCEGKISGASHIARDITEHKKVESQFLRAQRMESIGTLAGGIAHDLNNVLGPIITALQLLKMESASPETFDLLEILEESAKRGADVVGQILSFARGVEGERVKLDLEHLLSKVRRIVSETFPKGILLQAVCARDLPMIMGDPTQLHQVLLNLCINARDAMPCGGLLRISMHSVVLDEHYAAMDPEARPGCYVLIEVEDSGSGIAPEHLDLIFEPFFTTKSAGKGTGLGLATTHAIVKNHNGFIRVSSRVGSGSTFRIYLPHDSRVLTAESRPDTPALCRGNGELILMVDDEAPIRRVTGRTLEAYGYRVLPACDGAEALALYATRQQEISVVLTDMSMPVLDGLTTIQALRRMNPAARIISASGMVNNEEVQKAAEFGVKHFVRKPYTAEALLSVVRSALHPG